MHLADIAHTVKGVVFGDKNFAVGNIALPEHAHSKDLTFLFDVSTKTRAGAIITTQKIKGKNCIIVKDPKHAMYLLLKELAPRNRRSEISNQAIIEGNVSLPDHCTIEPFAIVKSGAQVGNHTYLGAHCYIDEGVAIGDGCEIFPNTIIFQNTRLGNFVFIDSNTVIGKQGFGFIKKHRFERLRHIGGVVIRDFVEIGSNVTIDRGTIGDTIIGEGTKIDNLVHIAHNVQIGNNCLIMGQVGIAGSTKIGNNVVLCGQVGVKDHLEVDDNVVVLAKSAVFKKLEGNKQYSGIPAREHNQTLRALARLYKGI